MFELDDLFERQLAAGDGAHQLQALGVGKDEQRPAGDFALEHLVNADQVADFVFAQGRDGAVAAHQRDLRHGQQDLLADHFAQAGGGAIDADIDHFRQGIEFEFGEDGGHGAAVFSRLAASARKSPMAFSVSGFCRKVAPTSRARVTTST